MRNVLIRFFSILVIMSVLSASAFATNTTSVGSNGGYILRASQYISSCNAAVSAASGALITINSNVTGTGIMSTIGAASIQIQKYQSGAWVTMKTLYNYYEYNSMSALIYVTYQGTAGSQYRAIVTFYAANTSGSDTRILTSNSVTAAN